MDDKLSDEQAIELVLEGDSNLYAQIVERYEPKLMRYVFSMIRDTSMAGDIVQGAAGMIPSMMTSAVNPAMGLQMMGLSAAGSSAQEAMEQGLSGDYFKDINMHGNKITMLGTAVDPGDAVSLGQYQADSASAFTAAATATAAAPPTPS